MWAGSTGTARADHFSYIAAERNKQQAEPGTENWENVWWHFNEATYWSADANVDSDATAVVNAWAAAIAPLRWNKVPGSSTSDYLFREDASVCGGVPGCHRVTLWYAWPPYDANFIQRGEIIIDPTFTYAPTAGRKGLLAHEVGHVYGLHERYLDSLGQSGCNSSETTVMDDMHLNVLNQLVHCDGLEAPAAADTDRVASFWSKGQMVDWTASANGSVGTWRWYDLGWAEHAQRLELWWWNGSSWQYADVYTDYYDRIGVHRLTEDRQLSQSYNRSALGKPVGWYIVCGWPWFRSYGVWGTWTCGPYIYLN